MNMTSTTNARAGLRMLAMLLAAIAGLMCVTCIHAEPRANSPVTLVISYRAQPADRARLALHLEKTFSIQLEAWRRNAVMEGYELLMSVLVNAQSADAFLFLHFGDMAQLDAWRDIERSRPGGLTAEGLRLATPVTSDLARRTVHVTAPQRDTAQAFYLIVPHRVAASGIGDYKKFQAEYLPPLADGYIRENTLSAFSAFMNEYWVDAPWTGLLVFEVRDADALASREETKQRLRKQLSADPAWRAWLENKGDTRTELRTVLARAIVRHPHSDRR